MAIHGRVFVVREERLLGNRSLRSDRGDRYHRGNRRIRSTVRCAVTVRSAIRTVGKGWPYPSVTLVGEAVRAYCRRSVAQENSAGAPPVCQNRTVSAADSSPERIIAIRPAMARPV